MCCGYMKKTTKHLDVSSPQTVTGFIKVQDGKKAIKIGFMLVLGVVATLSLVGVYFYERQQRLLRESPFLQEMNALVGSRDFGAATKRNTS